MELAIRMARWRNIKGLRMVNISKAIGIGVSTISSWEQGRGPGRSGSEPPPSRLAYYVEHGLGLSMSTFYSDDALASASVSANVVEEAALLAERAARLSAGPQGAEAVNG